MSLYSGLSHGSRSLGQILNLVFCDEILKTILLTGIGFYTPDNGFAANGVVIGNFIVHAAVVLGTIDSSIVHKSTLEYVNEPTVLLVIEKMTPRNFVCFATEGEVLIPAFFTRGNKFSRMAAAGAAAGINERIVVDVLVAELPESVSSGFMLDDTAEVESPAQNIAALIAPILVPT